MTTIEQDKALTSLERAFKKCKVAGLMFCGMDGDILYATQNAVDLTPDVNEGYCKTANAIQNPDFYDDIGRVNTHNAYDDSGGW